FYRARGYYDAHARAGRVEMTKDNHVRVTIDVEEGAPVVVHAIYLAGTEGLPDKAVRAAQTASGSQAWPSKVFDEDDFTKTDEALKRALQNHGFAYTQTSRRAEVDLPRHSVDLYFEVFPGPPAFFGPVTIEGLGDLPEGPVRRALKLREGKPYSQQDLDDAQQAVLDLGAFSAVTITPELPDPPPPNAVVPLRVKVERAKLRQVTLRGGIEFDPIQSDVHGIFGWEDRNFFGGFRRFRVRFTPGVTLYPLRAIAPLQAPKYPFLKEKLRADVRQPGFLEARTNGLVSSE